MKRSEADKQAAVDLYEDYVQNGDGDVAVAWLLAVQAFGLARANEMYP